MSTDPDWLDQQYNPRLQIPQFASFFAHWKAGAAEARARTKVYLDLPYGTEPAQTLDFFPAQGPSRPALIFLHGGYWRALDKSDFSWIAPPYVAAGISVAVVNYGLLPGTPLPQIVAQVRQACAWLHHNAQTLLIDPTRLLCAGHSAGAHLAAMMLTTDWPQVAAGLPKKLLSAAVTISGLFDLEPLTCTGFLRTDLKLDLALTRVLSPVFLPCRNEVPLLRAVGAEESGEFHRQSDLIAAAWPAACQTPLMTVAGCHHLSVCEAFANPVTALFRATSDRLSG